ncbi:hypothetical protein J1N35_021870 [Gossypium stocksii]|uniref:Uncharacterized protein n=1 Tax=Gossypium stocksii TaxID=47602 RepID=A0A9D3VGM4_9ROSI|nr:hypothetical protein J1N35_021870 [Gossypium stocksii]
MSVETFVSGLLSDSVRCRTAHNNPSSPQSTKKRKQSLRRQRGIASRKVDVYGHQHRKPKGNKSTNKIKTINSKEVLTVGITQGIELQIGQWKGKKGFEVIHLDDYDFVLGLNFLDKINALLVPFTSCICILDVRQRQYIVSVSRDWKGGIKVLLTIQLVEDVHCGKNIGLVDRNATKTLLEMLEVWQIDMKLVELSVGLPPMKEMCCTLDFVGKVMMQIVQLKQVNNYE